MADGTQPTAIVTAASKGIGAACARELARRGYRLAIMARSDAILDVAGEIGAQAFQGDVTNTEDLARFVMGAHEHLGRIDALVANTGLSTDNGGYDGSFFDSKRSASIVDYDDAFWIDMFDMQFMNVVRLARLVTPIMKAQGSGGIVNISAMISKEPHPAYPSSSTIRRALDGYTKLYADRHARDGIRMNTLSPGFVSNIEWNEAQLDAVPMGRPVNPEELARIAAFLLSEDSAYITGQNILADGGFNRGV
ncbi:MAG: SDR family oxidoreductase [Pseudomonadota bacterium]